MELKGEQLVKTEPINEYDIKVEKGEESLNTMLNNSQIKSELTAIDKSSSEDHLNASNNLRNRQGQVSASGKRKLAEGGNFYFVDHVVDTFISSEVIGEKDYKEKVCPNYPSSDPLAI